MKVKFHRLREDVQVPEYHTGGSVAFDLRAAEEVTVESGGVVLVSTGLVIETPVGFVLVVASRSSLPRKKGLELPHGIGIIDQDYCGPEDEVKLQVRNFTSEAVKIEKGERICQGMFVRVEKAEWEESEKPHREESRGGFGSTAGYGG